MGYKRFAAEPWGYQYEKALESQESRGSSAGGTGRVSPSQNADEKQKTKERRGSARGKVLPEETGYDFGQLDNPVRNNVISVGPTEVSELKGG